jgi:hypothetical protein
MKPTLIALLALGLCLSLGCGKKEPKLSTEKVITPDEAANELFVEAIELVSKAKSEENTNIPAAIKSYEEALVKVRKIVNEYKKSDLAVKLVSGETLFTGKSMAQIEERVDELQIKIEKATKDGGWQVDFTTNQFGAPIMLINLPSQGIANCAVAFEGETVPANFQPSTINYVKPTQLPVAMPFGRLFHADLTYLPGVVTFDLFANDSNATHQGRRHEVELLPRGLVVNRKLHKWKNGTGIKLSPEDKKDWPGAKLD